MYRRILFAVDAEGLAEEALPVVVTLARPGEARVTVLAVRDTRYDLELPRSVAGHVKQVADRLIEAGVDAVPEVRSMFGVAPSAQIVAAARELGADLVALGSHGRSRAGGLLLGSVGHEVAARLDVPVLLVHGSARAHAAPIQPIRRILVPVDGSDGSRAAVTAARDLAAEHAAAVMVVHARETAWVGGGTAYVEPDEAVSDMLADATDRLAASGRLVLTRVLEGQDPTAARIATAADDWLADLIVLGSRRLTDLGGLLLGSVAHDVVRRTRRPVLLAERAPAHVR